MARKVLTAIAVDRARAPAEGRRMDWDAVVPSLALRTTPNGAKSWVVMTRLRGRLIFHTIGRYPGLSLTAARNLAREDLEMVARGEDPRARRSAPTAEEGAFKTLADEFLDRAAKQTRTYDETKRIVEKELIPKWRTARISELGRREVTALLDAIVDRGAPVMANRVLGVASRIFSFALNRGLIEAHPCFRLKKPGREGKRERVLSEEEIRKLWKAWDQMAFPFGYLSQFLLVTAQRRGEASEMAWAEIGADHVWRMPRTKAGNGNEVPLSVRARQILERAPRKEGTELVFTTNGKTCVSGFSKAAATAVELSGVTGWTIHDLRRTAATFMARIGIPKITISRVLNHAEGGVTSIYARHGYLDEKRNALDRWATRLIQILEENKASDGETPSSG